MSNKKSLVRLAVQVLLDWRVWIVALAFSALCLSAYKFGGPIALDVTTVPLGLVGGLILSRLDYDPGGKRIALAELIQSNNILYAVTGIMIVQGSDSIADLALLPLHFFYGEKIEAHSWIIALAICLHLLSVMVAGCCIGFLIPKRALFAALVGVAGSLPLTLRELFANGKVYAVARHWQLANAGDADFDASTFDMGAGFGAVFAILVRGLLIVYVARLVSTRLSTQPASIELPTNAE